MLDALADDFLVDKSINNYWKLFKSLLFDCTVF